MYRATSAAIVLVAPSFFLMKREKGNAIKNAKYGTKTTSVRQKRFLKKNMLHTHLLLDREGSTCNTEPIKLCPTNKQKSIVHFAKKGKPTSAQLHFPKTRIRYTLDTGASLTVLCPL